MCALFHSHLFSGCTFTDIEIRSDVCLILPNDSEPQVRNSIRALFPERDCFTLVRPLNDEKDLQKLDQIPVSCNTCLL